MTKYVLTFDMDGVLCRPPLGINPGKGVGKLRKSEGSWHPLWLTERWRYRGRKPMPGALPGWLALAEEFDCKVVSARAEDTRPSMERWFSMHFGFVPEIHLRPSWRETSAGYKVRKMNELKPLAHFEDDPHTASWLADILPIVFLVDWPRNHWVQNPKVQRIQRIGQARLDLERVLGGLPPEAITGDLGTAER